MTVALAAIRTEAEKFAVDITLAIYGFLQLISFLTRRPGAHG